MVILKFNYIKSKYFIIIAKLARLPSASIIWPKKSPYIKAILFLQFNNGRVGGKWHLLFTNKIGSVQKLSYLLFENAVHFSDTIYYRTNETAALCFFTFSYCLSFCTFYVCLAFPVRSQSLFLNAFVPINIEHDLSAVTLLLRQILQNIFASRSSSDDSNFSYARPGYSTIHVSWNFRFLFFSYSFFFSFLSSLSSFFWLDLFTENPNFIRSMLYKSKVLRNKGTPIPITRDSTIRLRLISGSKFTLFFTHFFRNYR